ncbi:hypothetical protein RRG08_034727 [Elysia crispata]|uniref:Uncharacterized protein n=1 Tax=Elysia crispata TaxID=231223 RepID=A0AAE0Y256_9GAST|nr:hypothetical protein RRG08_034727 [Elysia crispata]
MSEGGVAGGYGIHIKDSYRSFINLNLAALLRWTQRDFSHSSEKACRCICNRLLCGFEVALVRDMVA